MHGFVYIMGNRSMPGIFKIGRTEGSPHLRAEQLSSSTGVAKPFEVLAYVAVKDSIRAERQAHAELARYRVSGNREFFDCRISDAYYTLQGLAGFLSGSDPEKIAYSLHLEEQADLRQEEEEAKKLVPQEPAHGE